MKAIIPAQSKAAPKPTEPETPPKALAIGSEHANASIVPTRASATWMPIASANS